MFSRFIFLVTIFILASRSNASDNCREMTFEYQLIGKDLKGHELQSFETSGCKLCKIKCYINEMCVFYNCGKNTCDLNSSDHTLHPGDLKEDEGKIYRASENACQKHQCQSNATCLNGFTDKGYKCKCHPGSTGDFCEKAVVHGGWSTWTTWSPCSAKTCKEQGNKTRYRNCTNPAPENGGEPCKGPNISTMKCTASPCSCQEIRQAQPHKAIDNMAYNLFTDNGTISVYCHMTEIPGCGAVWTLAMKINGLKKTFQYDSPYWINKTSYNERGGLTGLDDEETKLPTYWSTPFTKICLGMKVQGETRFLLINQSASSLYSLIANGKYKNTSLGRDAWKSLIKGSSLQPKCNKEGFNTRADSENLARARIGIISNEQDDCGSCDSSIGFGTWGENNDYGTCGNVAYYGPDNGDKNTKAMGYIFVQ